MRNGRAPDKRLRATLGPRTASRQERALDPENFALTHDKLDRPLRIGFIGSGFIARFHARSFLSVRNAEIRGVFSPTQANRDALARDVTALELGQCTAHATLEALLASDIDAIWLLSPNDTRLETMRAIVTAVREGRSRVRAVACEKPLARSLAEARTMLGLAESVGLLHGYLENQVFASGVERGKEIIWRRAVPAAGRPYLARAAEEHSGPHEAWFWQGRRQGGGVLSDMMCHSIEVARYLLSDPTEPRDALRPVRVQGHVANLKWTRPLHAAALKERYGAEVDFTRRPVEDFARGTIELQLPDGGTAIIEATTSWAYVGAGLRLDIDLMGPEYSLQASTLDSGLKVFFSRAIAGADGEDLVEKQNAEQGLMPVIEDEAGTYGYTGENRHMVECFRRGVLPRETFTDGVAVVELVMALYKSAEEGRMLSLPDASLETYLPPAMRD